jgi:hypothetical protein
MENLTMNELSDISYLEKTKTRCDLSLMELNALKELKITNLKINSLTIQNVAIEDFVGFPKNYMEFCHIYYCHQLSSLRGLPDINCDDMSIYHCKNISNLKHYNPKIKYFHIEGSDLKSLKGFSLNPKFSYETLKNFEKRYPHLKWSDIEFNITREDIEKYKNLYGDLIYYFYYLIDKIKDDEINNLKELVDEDNYNHSRVFLDMIKDDIEGIL